MYREQELPSKTELLKKEESSDAASQRNKNGKMYFDVKKELDLARIESLMKQVSPRSAKASQDTMPN